MSERRSPGGSVRVAEERISLQEAADALGISEQTARRWVKSRKLKAYKPGLRYLIPASAIEELLEGAEAPKVLLPFDVLEVRAEVMRRLDAQTGKELVDALDAEYVRRLEDWSLEDIRSAEDALLEEYQELSKALPTPPRDAAEDSERYYRWIRVWDELRAVLVARVARGVPFRDKEA
jgi:excisionase family DNA binding protein